MSTIESSTVVDTAKPTDLSVQLRALRSFGPEHFHLLEKAAEEIDRYYGGMMAWKQTAETKDRKLSQEIEARITERIIRSVPWSAQATANTITLNYDFASAILGALFNPHRATSVAYEEIKQQFAAIMRGEKPAAKGDLT